MKRDRPCVRGSRKSRWHGDRAPAPAGPSARACSCRGACRSPRLRSRPSPLTESRSWSVHRGQDPGKRFGIHVRRHDEPTPIRQGDLNPTLRRPTGITATRLGRWSFRHHSHRREQSPGRRPKFTVAILTSPRGQQRSANAMPPRRGRRLAVADEAFIHDAQFVIIGPRPAAIAIGSGQNLDLRAVDEVGHKVGLTTGA